jgi:hypothetical protein
VRSFAEKPMVINGKLKQVGRCFRAGNNVKRSAVFECSCSGIRIILTVSNVRSGHTTSCGCAAEESRLTNTRTHGMSDTRMYRIHAAMLRRCLNQNTKEYPDYGGRGITVCDRWKSFEAFIEDMGHAPESLTLDRIDVNGNYCPENCRWATMKTQQRNRRNNRLLTFDGITMCSADWADRTGISQNAINLRLKRGWSVERTLTIPLISSNLERSR